jgi:Xaa-Pro aminopeptidase
MDSTERRVLDQRTPQARSEAEIAILREGAALADVGLQAAWSAIRPNASATAVLDAVRTAIRDAGGETSLEMRIIHGLPLADDDAASPDSELHAGELVWVSISGKHRGFAYAGARLTSVGTPSDAAQAYIAHLAETAEWAIESIEPGVRRRFVLTETRGRLLRVRGSGIGAKLTEPPTIEPNTWVELAPGTVLRLEVSLTCDTFGTGSISDMILIGPEKAGRLTRCPHVES